MNWRRYQNELIVGAAFVMMMLALAYKQITLNSQAQQRAEMYRDISEIEEVVALKEIWGNKNLSKKVDILQSVVPSTKVKWNKKQKALTASYSDLTSQEVNNLGKKLMNLPVEIQKLEIKRDDKLFDVELQCKW